jgi:hypothetical protein
MLKSAYSSLIIKKDTILYHLTDEEFSNKPDKKYYTQYFIHQNGFDMIANIL